MRAQLHRDVAGELPPDEGAAESTFLARSQRICGASSRRGGKAQFGSVSVRRTPAVVCEHCNGTRLDLGGPHAPRWAVLTDGRKALVDCAGREVNG